MESYFKQCMEHISHIQAKMSAYQQTTEVFYQLILPKVVAATTNLGIQITGYSGSLGVLSSKPKSTYSYVVAISLYGQHLDQPAARRELHGALLSLQVPMYKTPFTHIGKEKETPGKELILQLVIPTELEIKRFN